MGYLDRFFKKKSRVDKIQLQKPETKVTITTQPAQRLPGINIRPTDKPGEAAARARGRGGGASIGGQTAPTTMPTPQQQAQMAGASISGVTAQQAFQARQRQQQAPSSSVTRGGMGPGGTSTQAPYKPSFGTKAKLAWRDIKESKDLSRWDSWGQALKRFETQKVSEAEKKKLQADYSYRQIPSGTIISGLGLPDFENISPGEYAWQRDIVSGVPMKVVGVTPQAAASITSETVSKGVSSSYQKRIDTGELKYNTPEEQAIVQTQFQQEATAKYEDIFPSIYSKIRAREQGIITINPVRTYGTAAVIAGTLAVASPTVVGYEGAILGRTIYGAASAGMTSKYVSTALFSPSLNIKQRIFTGGTGVLTAGVGLWLGASAFGGGRGSLLSQWNIKDLTEDLSKTTMKFSGKELYSEEKGSYYKLTGERLTKGGSAKQVVDYNLASLKTGKPEVFAMSESGQPILIEKGREGYSFFLKNAKSTTKIYDFISGSTLKSTELFGGGGRVVAFGEGLSFGKGRTSVKFPEFQTGTGSYYLRTPGKEGFKSFKFFGAGTEKEGKIFMISGTPSKVLYGYGEGIKVRGTIGAYGTIIKAPLISEGNIINIVGGGTKRLKMVAPSVLATPQITQQAAAQTFALTSGKIAKLTTPTALSTLSLQATQAETTRQLLTPRLQQPSLVSSSLKSSLTPMTKTLTITAQIPVTRHAYSFASAQAQQQQQQQQQQIQQPIFRVITPSPNIFPKIKPFIEPKIPFIISPFKKQKILPERQARFPVLLRRFGQFKIIGYGRTPQQALSIGREAASKTLGATFKIPGLKSQKIFGFKTKKSKKEGLLFIEEPRFRLSTPTEKREIKLYGRYKRKRRSRR